MISTLPCTGLIANTSSPKQSIFFIRTDTGGFHNGLMNVLRSNTTNEHEAIIWKEIIIGMNKIRSGRKNRDVALKIGETVLEHSLKVGKAAMIYGRHISGIDRKKLKMMGDLHDISEYKEKDYTPGEITKEEKHKREEAVILGLKDYFCITPSLLQKREEIYLLWEEFEKRETKEAKIVRDIDLLDAAVQAMEYEKMGYKQMTDFYPYTLENLHDATLKNILEILLKKQYPTINTYEQYFLLLANNGDEAKFTEKMEKKLDRQNRKLASPF